MSVSDNKTPNKSNTVDVMIGCCNPSDPSILSLYVSGWLTTEIDFDSGKKFIQFTFPNGFTKFDIRVFAVSEEKKKKDIMDAYKKSSTQGVEDFDAMWGGKASNGGKKREFIIHEREGQTMTVRDKDTDTKTPDGTLHFFILRYTYGYNDYLFDPSIRNRT